MSIKIPLNLGPQLVAPITSDRPGVRLKLPFRLGGATTTTVTEMQVLRSVAAAAALLAPAEGLKLAKQARDNPEDVIAPEIDEQRLNAVLLAVTRVQSDRSDAPVPNDQHRAVARAVGADPVLVAAAYAAMENDQPAIDNALKWVAVVNAELLDNAARVGASERQLDLVPTQLGRMERLEKVVADVKEKVTKIDTRVRKLEGTATAPKRTPKRTPKKISQKISKKIPKKASPSPP